MILEDRRLFLLMLVVVGGGGFTAGVAIGLVVAAPCPIPVVFSQTD